MAKRKLQKSHVFVTKVIDLCNIGKIHGKLVHAGPDLADSASPVANPARWSLDGVGEGDIGSVHQILNYFILENTNFWQTLRYTLQHIACAFATKLLRVCYKIN